MFGSGTASGKNLTDQFISVNQYGYDIDKITVTGLNVNLCAGDLLAHPAERDGAQRRSGVLG